LDIDFLKIDKRFIDKMHDNDKSLVVVDAIIKMAHTLGVEVVAEGVEYEEQFNLLKALGCDYVQGYLFSKPLEPDAFLDFVEKKTSLNKSEK